MPNPLEMAIAAVIFVWVVAVHAVIATVKFVFGLFTKTVHFPWSTDANQPTEIMPSQQAAVEPLVQAQPIKSGNIDVADYFVSISFSHSFSASVGIYKDARIAKRTVRAISRPAAALMQQIYLTDRFHLTDVALTNGVTSEDVINDTEAVGIKFIEDLLKKKDPNYFTIGSKHSIGGEPSVKVISNSLAALRGDVAMSETPSQRVQPLDIPTSVVVTPRKTTALTFGRVQSFGMRSMMFQSKRDGKDTPGEVFEAVLIQDDGLHASFRGVRLQELFHNLSVQLGDRIELACLGRTRVDNEGGRPTFRNEFTVKVLESAS